MKLLRLTYDPARDVVLTDLAGVRLETREDIDRHWAYVLDWWKRTARGQKRYYVVCYDGFSLNLRESDYYGKRMLETIPQVALTVVRYGGDPLQRGAARVRAMKIHMPSNLYDSIDEALEIVGRIRSGDLSVAQG